MESISTEKTRAPSLARSAARGRPTTSDLGTMSGMATLVTLKNVPVDDGDGFAICTVPVRQEVIVHPSILEAFNDGQRRARQDGLDEARRSFVVDHRRGRLARCH